MDFINFSPDTVFTFSPDIVFTIINFAIISIILAIGLRSARAGIIRKIGSAISLLGGFFLFPFFSRFVSIWLVRNEQFMNFVSLFSGRIVEEGVDRTGISGITEGMPLLHNLQAQGLDAATGTMSAIIIRIMVFGVIMIGFKVVLAIFFRAFSSAIVERIAPLKWLNHLLGFLFGLVVAVIPIWIAMSVMVLLSGIEWIAKGLEFITQVPTLDILFRVNPFLILLS